MKLADIILLGIMLACVAFVIYRIVKRKKKGGGGCGCSGCEGCAMRGSCEEEKKKKN